MKFRLKGLCAIGVVLLGIENCSAMNLDTSRMRPPHLWARMQMAEELNKQLLERDRINAQQRKQISTLRTKLAEQIATNADQRQLLEKNHSQISEQLAIIEEQLQKNMKLQEALSEKEEIIKQQFQQLAKRDKRNLNLAQQLKQELEERQRVQQECDILEKKYSKLRDVHSESMQTLNKMSSEETLYEEESAGKGKSEDGLAKKGVGGQWKNADIFSDPQALRPSTQKNSKEGISIENAGNFQSDTPAQQAVSEKDSENPDESKDQTESSDNKEQKAQTRDLKINGNIPPAPPPPPMKSKAVIPPAPPPPPMMSNGTVPPPPPPMMSGNASQVKESAEDFFAKRREGLYENLIFEKTAAKIANLYLKSHPEEIRQRIQNQKNKIKTLCEELRDWQKQYELPSSESNKSKLEGKFDVNNLINRVEKLCVIAENLSKNRQQNNDRSLAAAIDRDINQLAVAYINEMKEDKVPYSLIQIGEQVLKSIQLADTLRDLENLKEVGFNRKIKVTDQQVTQAFKFVQLGQAIEKEVKQLEKKVKKNEPSEIRILNKLKTSAYGYFLDICNGKPQFKKLNTLQCTLKRDQKLMASIEKSHTPLLTLVKWQDEITQLQGLFDLAWNDQTQSSYSQFGTLDKGDQDIIGFQKLDVGHLKQKFAFTDLSGEFGDDIIKFITVDQNLSSMLKSSFSSWKKKLFKIETNKSPNKPVATKASTHSQTEKDPKVVFWLQRSEDHQSIIPTSVNIATQLTGLNAGVESFTKEIRQVSQNLRTLPNQLVNLYCLEQKESPIFNKVDQMLTDQVGFLNAVLNYKPAKNGDTKNPTTSGPVNTNSLNLSFFSREEVKDKAESRAYAEINGSLSKGKGHVTINVKTNGKTGSDLTLTQDEDMFGVMIAVFLNRDLIEEPGSSLFITRGKKTKQSEVEKMAWNLTCALREVSQSLDLLTATETFKNLALSGGEYSENFEELMETEFYKEFRSTKKGQENREIQREKIEYLLNHATLFEVQQWEDFQKGLDAYIQSGAEKITLVKNRIDQLIEKIAAKDVPEAPEVTEPVKEQSTEESKESAPTQLRSSENTTGTTRNSTKTTNLIPPLNNSNFPWAQTTVSQNSGAKNLENTKTSGTKNTNITSSADNSEYDSDSSSDSLEENLGEMQKKIAASWTNRQQTQQTVTNKNVTPESGTSKKKSPTVPELSQKRQDTTNNTKPSETLNHKQRNIIDKPASTPKQSGTNNEKELVMSEEDKKKRNRLLAEIKNGFKNRLKPLNAKNVDQTNKQSTTNEKQNDDTQKSDSTGQQTNVDQFDEDIKLFRKARDQFRGELV